MTRRSDRIKAKVIRYHKNAEGRLYAQKKINQKDLLKWTLSLHLLLNWRIVMILVCIWIVSVVGALSFLFA